MKRDPSGPDRWRESNSSRRADGRKQSDSADTQASRRGKLHRSLGNQAVQRLHEKEEVLQTKPDNSPSADKYGFRFANRSGGAGATMGDQLPEPEQIGALVTQLQQLQQQLQKSGGGTAGRQANPLEVKKPGVKR